MQDELAALAHDDTWVPVPRKNDMHVVGSKWVFKTKLKSDGFVDRLKARSVAKGFTRQEGMDYEETYSPVIKPTTIRIILSLDVIRGWPIHQLDVKNAFLHGQLCETVTWSNLREL